MRKSWVLFLWALVFLGPCGLYADVVLTDQQYQELDGTLTQLQNTLTAQDGEIVTLKLRNEELQTLSDSKQKQLDEQQKEINKAKSSYKRHNIFSILQSILIAIVSLFTGGLIGHFLF